MKKPELYAYLAGAIDSDGTIGVKRSTYAMRVTKDSTQPIYSERVALRQVTKEIPELLKECFGGALYMTKPSTPNGRPLWSWAVTDMRAVACLVTLMPYLLVKREQAKNAIALRRVKDRSKAWRVRPNRGHAGSSNRHARFSVLMEARYLRAKELNRTGV